MYILQMISLKEKSLYDYTCIYNNPNSKIKKFYSNLDDYMRISVENNPESKYEILIENICYANDLEMVQEYISKNILDVNDGGSFKYAKIIQVQEDVLYPLNEYFPTYIYEYNQSTDTYSEIDESHLLYSILLNA